MLTPLDGLAHNPAAPVDLLIRLLDVDAAGLAYRRHLPDPLVDAMVSHPRRAVREILAMSLGATGAQRARLVHDPAASIREIIASGETHRRGRSALPAVAYETLAADQDADVRRALMLAPALPDQVWARLLDDPDTSVRTSAMISLAPGRADIAARLARVASREALSVTAFTRSRFADLATDPDPEIRQAIAANRHTPHDLLLALGHDPDPSVRLAAALNPELSDQERDGIDYDGGPRDDLRPPSWWANCLDDLPLMRRAAGSTHHGLRRAAAYSPWLPADLVTRLAADEDFVVRLILAEHHPDAPGELLLAVAVESPFVTRFDQIHHRNFPREGLADRVACSPDPAVRLLAVLDPEAPPSLIEALSEEFPTSAASSDPRLPRARVLALYADSRTRPVAAANPLLPVELMLEILGP